MRDRARPLRTLVRVVLPAASSLVLVASCVDSTIVQFGQADVVSVGISPDSAELPIGDTLQFRGFPLDETGALLAGLAVEWRI